MTEIRPTAIITGISGQDGWYLASRLLELGYNVLGTTHRAGAERTIEIDGKHVPLLAVNIADMFAVEQLIRTHRPDEIYNFAARASSAQLFDDPLATAEINGVAVACLLESIRRHSSRTKFCQASSSEIFAGTTQSPQDEGTPIVPLSAYGAAKAFADHLVAAYRSAYGLHACSAILYPHESPRRPPHFLVRKVAQAAARIRAGLQDTLVIGNLDAIRDWGYAPDYVEAMRRMLASEEPRDYVIASGVAHSVADVCRVAFEQVGLTWNQYVVVDDALKRPPESVLRVGNPARARNELHWEPTLDFRELIRHIVEFDRLLLERKNTD